MSKATVYAYHRDKDDLFAAVAARIVSQLKSGMNAALKGRSPLHKRIADALTSKYNIVFQHIHNSPFADELYEARDFVVGDMFVALDDDTRKMIADALVHEGATPAKAKSTARILLSSSQGVARDANSFQQVEADIRLLAEALTTVP